MKLEIECTWDDKKKKAKQIIHFDYRPKTIFQMPEERISYLQELNQKAPMEGPPVLVDFRNLVELYSKSLYAHVSYYQSLRFFEYFEEAEEVFTKIKKTFSGQVFTSCLIAEAYLHQKEYGKFVHTFKKIEVLKGVFPKRRDFFYEEAIFFHNLWGRHFFETGDEIQAEKHKNLILLILNSFQSLQVAANA